MKMQIATEKRFSQKTRRIINYILTSLVFLSLTAGSGYAETLPTDNTTKNAMNTVQTIAASYEITSSLIVNGRVLGPQKFLAGDKKTHIGIFKESGTRKYQVTYNIKTDPTKDDVVISTSVSATVFSPSFQLMGGQRASARQVPELPEMEVVVSARKLTAPPQMPETGQKRMAH